MDVSGKHNKYRDKEKGVSRNPAMVIKAFYTSVAGATVLAMFFDLEKSQKQKDISIRLVSSLK